MDCVTELALNVRVIKELLDTDLNAMEVVSHPSTVCKFQPSSFLVINTRRDRLTELYVRKYAKLCHEVCR